MTKRSEIQAKLKLILDALRERKLAALMPGKSRGVVRQQYLAQAKKGEVGLWVLAGIARYVAPDLVDGRTGNTLKHTVGRVLREDYTVEMRDRGDYYEHVVKL